MKTAFFMAFMLSASLVLGTTNSNVAVQQDDKKQSPQSQDIKQEARQSFMRGKLLMNQQIVEGLSTNDFKLIAEGAESVVALVKGQHWFVVDTPEYRKYSEEMQTTAKLLNEAAKAEKLEASTLRYFELTLKCIDCHQYYLKKF